MKKFLALFVFIFISVNLHAGDIGFGKILAIKHYDFATSKYIKVYFETDPTHKTESCRETNYIRGFITLDAHSEASVNRMLSMLISAQATGSKVRLYSEGTACEIDFVSIQETYF